MSKYEELKDYVANIKAKYQNKIENTDVEQLKEVLSEEVLHLKHKEQRLVKYEKIIKEMLEGFFDDEFILMSFVYENIRRTFLPSGYEVRERHFTTIEAAINYSISLGERVDWLQYAYHHI